MPNLPLPCARERVAVVGRVRRTAMMGEPLPIARDDVATVPVFQRVIVWGAKDNIELVPRADNWSRLRHVRVR